MAEIEPLLSAAGFLDVAIRERFDPFRATPKERTARKYGVVGANIYALKPREV